MLVCWDKKQTCCSYGKDTNVDPLPPTINILKNSSNAPNRWKVGMYWQCKGPFTLSMQHAGDKNVNHKSLNSHCHPKAAVSVTIPGHRIIQPSGLSARFWLFPCSILIVTPRQLSMWPSLVCTIRQFSGIQMPLLFGHATSAKSTFD